MSQQNLRRYFSEIQEKFGRGLKDADEHTIEQIRMDIELLRMIGERIKEISHKKRAIASVQASITARNTLIAEFTELISSMSDQFKTLNDQATKKNSFLYSPYNNTKPLSSFEVLNYAKKISHSLQAPKNYEPGQPLPINFVLPFPSEDVIVRSYIYLNSRTDGKVSTKCQTPHHGITNKFDIINFDGKTYHMKRSASVIITANEPKDSMMAYTMDGSIPTPFSERQMTNGETIDIPDSCTLKIIACKYGYLDSDLLELEFIIDRVEDLRDPNKKAGVNNAEFAVRPNILEDTKISGGIEFLDTPYSMGRTPSYSFTPSYTPSYREPYVSRDQADH